MQPYFFPYIGYWQLMKLTDRYVVYDDVNYIKGGWINRNRILVNGRAVYLNVPTVGASPNKKINQVGTEISERFLEKTSRKLSGAYKKAPYFEEVFPYIMEMMDFSTDNLSEYLISLILKMAQLLDIKTDFIISSQLSCSPRLHGEERVMEICRVLEGDIYYNAVGGRQLYSHEHFRERGLELRFVETDDIRYQQFGDTFVPNLSIIDILMFNGWEQTKKYLDKIV